jgi:sialic acid synthase SpsE
MAGEEITDEKRNILAALAKRRNGDLENAKPLVEVAAELSAVHHLS